MLKIFCKIISDKKQNMSSRESHHKIVANNLTPDTIVSFKAGSEVKDTTSHVPHSTCLKYSSWLTNIVPALHYNDLKSEVVKHMVCTHEYQLKSPFLELIQGMPGHVNPKRTVFTYQEISDWMCIYFYHRRNQFFRDQDDKACWIKGDPLEACFEVETFHWHQLRPLIMAQLIPLRRSPRNTN